MSCASEEVNAVIFGFAKISKFSFTLNYVEILDSKFLCMLLDNALTLCDGVMQFVCEAGFGNDNDI